jgi:mRNA-degrading endonuclease HigB of HigAB toxin-antitoxin module
MVKKVITRPNPFNSFLTLNVTCELNRHVIVRISGEHGEIVSMFGWSMIKGTNITTINETDKLEPGTYHLCIMDQDGSELFRTQMEKQ